MGVIILISVLLTLFSFFLWGAEVGIVRWCSHLCRNYMRSFRFGPVIEVFLFFFFTYVESYKFV